MFQIADRDTNTQARAGADLSTRSVVFVASHDRIADCFIHAVQREFPQLSVHICRDANNVAADYLPPVSLILVDALLVAADGRSLAAMHRAHPRATVAVTVDDPGELGPILPTILSTPSLRGVLPMNLKLDVWLSVLGLMVRGGEYFPATLLRPQAPAAAPAPRTARDEDQRAPRATQHDPTVDTLTDRERQVLELVARGTPNKLIATEFGLSEHTVKIHMHNIIRKLRVHNRTEAAAFFLRAPRPDFAPSGLA